MAITIQAPALELEVIDYEGNSFDIAVDWRYSDGTPVNLSGATAALQVRISVDDAVLVELTSSSGIVLGGSPYNIVASFTAAQSALIGAGKFVFDVQITLTGGAVRTPIFGKIKLKKSVTRL